MRSIVTILAAVALAMPVAAAEPGDAGVFAGVGGSCVFVGLPGIVNTTSEECGSGGGGGGAPALPIQLPGQISEVVYGDVIWELLLVVIGLVVGGDEVACVAVEGTSPTVCGAPVTLA